MISKLIFFNFKGDSIEAIGVSWHTDHFLCHECHIPLTENFGQDGFYIYENEPYCEKDFRSIVEKLTKQKNQERKQPGYLTPTRTPSPKSPFASPKNPRRKANKPKAGSYRQPSTTTTTTTTKKHETTLRTSANAFIPAFQNKPPFRRLLEQEKRASFLLQKETPGEYVYVRSNLKSFQSTSEVTPRRSSIPMPQEEKPKEEEISIVPMRSSGLPTFHFKRVGKLIIFSYVNR